MRPEIPQKKRNRNNRKRSGMRPGCRGQSSSLSRILLVLRKEQRDHMVSFASSQDLSSFSEENNQTIHGVEADRSRNYCRPPGKRWQCDKRQKMFVFESYSYFPLILKLMRYYFSVGNIIFYFYLFKSPITL